MAYNKETPRNQVEMDANTGASQMRIAVRVKASEARRNDDGTWTIVMPGKQLTQNEIDTLHSFYPTLFPTAMSLLHKEALLQNVIDEF